MGWHYTRVGMMFTTRGWEIIRGSQSLREGMIDDYLNKLGESGWELVGVVPVSTSTDGNVRGQVLWFKKPWSLPTEPAREG